MLLTYFTFHLRLWVREFIQSLRKKKLAPEDTRIPNVSRTQSQWTARRDRVSSLVFEGARNEVASGIVVAELRSAVHKGKIQRSHGIGFTFVQGVLVL